MKEHFIFWQQYVESEDAQRFVKFYPVHTYPYVSVIDPRTGEKLVEWNELDSTIFCDLVTDFLSNRSSLSEAAAQTKETESQPPLNKRIKSDNNFEEYSVLDATEEDQITMAIKASLEASKETVRNLDSDSEGECEEVESNSSCVLSPTPSKATAVQSCVSTAETCMTGNSNATRKWEDYLGDPKGPVSSIMIRFPDGQRESKTFPANSKLLAVILYVVSKGYPSETHEIVTNFPRRIITDLDDSKSLRELDLYPQETIFVQNR
eukprot:TRINITY_DN7748_c0_g1_i1.p1 TRINITY_DN7748_c0_g1~~TRINITY_DN7748_c0_g1_i1.p1  ORF type:complete len:264 (-),score=40.63 TRINITY_DN7748_c0_g1_i1:146-937(-)